MTLRITKKQRLIAAAVLIVPAFILYKILGYRVPTIVLMILATIVSGFPIFRKAFFSLRRLVFSIELLVTIAVVGAIIIGEYWEAAAVSFLFMLGDYLEARTIDKTRSALRELLLLAPATARVITDGVEKEISSEEVRAGDVVLVKPGEKIPVDGVVLEGQATVNEATITGESLPVEKETAAWVYSGTIAEAGYLKIRAVKVGEDTTLARILEMVEEAQDKKAKTEKFIERFAKYYTPAVVILAVILYLVKRDLRMALTLLVIACPGALVISTPVSLVAGIGNGARRGVLFKGGEIIEKLASARAVALDKTGTISRGEPAVREIITYGLAEEEALAIAAAGEVYSEHPLAKAIVAAAREREIEAGECENVEILTGRGIKFKYKGKVYFAGSDRFLKENGLTPPGLPELAGATAVFLSDEEKTLAVIAIADAVRPEARSTITGLKRQGIEKIVMLSGDSHRAARAVGTEVGVDEYYGELLPADKAAILARLKADYATVVMVGDGVNDAPALASADLGVAIGGAGKEAVMETADIVLMGDRLDTLNYAFGLSRATGRILKQNIFFALAVAAALLLGVLTGKVSLALGMLVHEISVLLVIVNAARLLNYGKIYKKKKKG
ncbi:MAG TPA: cation-translocating P-type ATPase [Bacilli bacterium]|nr:cation-translocating P-type ATPase [Bacilli bacterium]